MFSVQMVTIIKISHQNMTCLESVSQSINTVLDHNAPLVTGSLSIGLEDSRMEELLLTQKWKATKDQRPSPSVTTKSSNAGTKPSPNSNKVMLPLSTAHPSMLTVMLSPGHQLEENQSHSTLISISKSKSWNAEELQNSLLNHHNQ